MHIEEQEKLLELERMHLSELNLEQLNEKTFELEVKTTDNRVIQDQLQQKNCECEELQETVTSLRQQLSEVLDKRNSSSTNPAQYSIDETSLLELLRRKENLQSRESDSELQQAHPAGSKTIDHVDLLREQQKILSGEVALSSSVLKQLSDEAANSHRKDQIQVEIRKVSDEIKGKKKQMFSLEKHIADLLSANKSDHEKLNLSQSYAALVEKK